MAEWLGEKVNNPPSKELSRNEATAFAIVGQLLGVKVQAADSNSCDSMPDGKWDHEGRTGVIEVTAPPDSEHMKDWATANKNGKIYVECKWPAPLMDPLQHQLQAILDDSEIQKNFTKLLNRNVDERHLYLHAYSYPYHQLFCRLVESKGTLGSAQPVSIDIPSGITAVWLQGTAVPDPAHPDKVTIEVASFSNGQWDTHSVVVDNTKLPGPPPFPGKKKPVM